MSTDAQTPSPTADGKSDPRYERPPFLTTARALPICGRELGRLADALIDGATALPTTGADDDAVVRRSPGRWIVQLGPVAITATWLRPTHGSVEGSELLVMVWRGAVAPRAEHCPERAPAQRAPGTATMLWEQTLHPVATDEASWMWVTAGAASDACSSSELASRAVERLRIAYERYATIEESDGVPPRAVARRKPAPRGPVAAPTLADINTRIA